jgi:hypothetical protein
VRHEFLPGVSAKLNEPVPAVGPHGETVALPGSFGEMHSMTVDAGELYAEDDSGAFRLDRFDASSGAFLGQFPQLSLSGRFELSRGVAVGHSTGEAQVYVSGYKFVKEGEGRGIVAVLDSAGSVLGVWTGADAPSGEGEIFQGVAVDGSSSLGDWAADDVYVADPSKGVVDVFKPEAGGGEKYVAQLTGPEPPGVLFSEPAWVAVNQSNGEVYVLDKGQENVDVFRPAAVVGQYEYVGKLAGPLAGGAFERARHITVDGGNGDVYVSEEVSGPEGEFGVIEQFNSNGEHVGRLTGTPAEAPFNSVLSMTVDPKSHDVYVGVRHNVLVGGEGINASVVDVFGPDVVIPDVLDEGASNVRPVSVTFNGRVNPDKEGEASCRFEWGTTREFGQVAPCEPEKVGEGSSLVGVHASVSGLLPDTTYYYRLQATNKNGTNPGEPVQDQEFTTSGPGIHSESVSNVTAASVTLEATIDPHEEPTTYYFQYGRNGGYEAAVPLVPGVSLGSGPSDVEVAQHVQGLLPATVYHYRVVAVSEIAPGELESFFGVDQAFTTQAATGGGGSLLLDDRQWELVSPADKHGARINGIAEGVVQAAVGGDAMTFLTRSPTENTAQGYTNDVQVLSARGPDGWVARDISIPHDRATGFGIGQGQEYRFFSEDLSLAVVQPFGSFDPSLSGEASEQTAYLRTNFLHGNVNEPCVLSCFRPLVTGKPGYANVPSGTVFGEEGTCPPQLICGPEFVGASSDLSHIALKSLVPLTATSGGQYEYEWADGGLSAGNRVPSVRLSTSADGSWTYFASGSVLAQGAVPASCAFESESSGLCNLYVSHGGVTRLVAVVSNEDSKDWQINELKAMTSRVSPDGRWFAFMSQRGLTGYDTRDAVSGKPDEEVYLYHAPADLASEAGMLVCASCNPTGARPIGVEYEKLNGNLVGGFSVWGSHQGIAANVPGWTPYRLDASLYQSRYLSDGGRLFFNSNDALVPQDVNGNEDVYEYEPPGTGGCTSGSVRFSERSGGCLGLVSSGQGTGESAFLDASGNGSDVFFVTAGKLVSQDYDTALDVYDARECSAQASCYPAMVAVSPPCGTGDACKPSPSPQPAIFGSPASATFVGKGNASTPQPGPIVKAKSLSRAQKLARARKACHSRKGKRRRVCERQARARYAARKSSNAAKRGRA